MKIATLLVGLPGSGKSTYIKNKFPNQEKVAIISSDKWIEMHADNNNSTYDAVFATYIKRATEIMEADFHFYTKRDDYDIIIDQTNLSVKKRKSWISRIPKGWQIDCVTFLPPNDSIELTECRLRLASRPGKTIPKNILSSMENSYVLPTIDEGYNCLTYVDLYGDLKDFWPKSEGVMP